MAIDQAWCPPNTLSGKHWRVECLHFDGSWRNYVELRTEHDADTYCSYMREYHPIHTWRIAEANNHPHCHQHQ